jgi:hypothetical protein
MKQLIIPIVIGLLAGLGGGTGYSYMKTSAKYVADSTQLADSLKAHPPADSTHADSTDGAASHDAAAHDSVPADSGAHGMDSPGSHEAAAPMTPADSIRLLDAARRDLKAVSAKPAPGKAVDTHAAAPDAHAAPSLKSQTQSATDAKSTAASAANVVKDARDAAMNTALPEQRLAKIFSAMAAKDAAKVLDQMTDGDIRTILGMMNDRQAAAILTSMTATRAAAITKGGSKAPGGSL